MRQHGFADYISNCVDRWIRSLQLLVDLNETARADLNLCAFKSWNFRVRFAANRNQNAVESFLTVLILQIFTFEGRANASAIFF